MSPAKVKPAKGGRSPEQRLSLLEVQTKRLEADVDNLKNFGLQLASRVLRLELAVSSLDKDDELRSILYPESEKL